MTPYYVNILGVRINSTSASSVLKKISDFEAISGQNGLKLRKPLIIFTPNPEFLVAAAGDDDYQKLLNSSDINIPDGFGLLLAGKILGRPIKERVSGADLVEKLLEVGNERKWKVGIIGARRGVLNESSELIKRLLVKYPYVKFTNLDDPKYKIPACRQAGQNTKYNLVLACHGMKKQEQWIFKNKKRFNTSVLVGVGGSLDFLAGFSKRAPVWIQKIGLEWLWRGLQKPGHIKRIWKAVIVFLWLVVKERILLKSRN